MMLRVPYSRPVRYAMLVTHTLRSALNDINVDLTGVEQSIADKIENMSAKIEALEARLAAYEESLGFQDERSSCKDTINGPDQEPKAKSKAKPRAKPKAKK